MPIEIAEIENTIAEIENTKCKEFIYIGEDNLTIIVNALKNKKVASIVRRLFDYRLSIAKNNPYIQDSCPSIYFIITELCNIKTIINNVKNIPNADNEQTLFEKYNAISEYIKNNLSTIEYELSMQFYLFASVKVDNFNGTIKEIEGIKSEIHIDRDEVNRLYAKTGVHLFSKKYSDIAADESFAKAAWLIVSCVFFIGIVWAVVWFTCNIVNLEKKTYFDLLYLYAERIPIIALLLAFFVWVSKRYAIAREKELIYRHLATTLHVFKAFYKTAEPEHKSLVLMEAAKTLFPAPIDNNTSKLPNGGSLLDVVKILSKTVAKDGGH